MTLHTVSILCIKEKAFTYENLFFICVANCYYVQIFFIYIINLQQIFEMYFKYLYYYF